MTIELQNVGFTCVSVFNTDFYTRHRHHEHPLRARTFFSELVQSHVQWTWQWQQSTRVDALFVVFFEPLFVSANRHGAGIPFIENQQRIRRQVRKNRRELFVNEWTVVLN